MNSEKIRAVLQFTCLITLSLFTSLTYACTSQPSPPPTSTKLAVGTPVNSAKPIDMQQIPGTQVPSGGDAEAAVRRTYEALARKDRNGYVDSIDPQARQSPSGGSALTFATQLLLGTKVDFEDVSFRDMNYSTTQNSGTWASVRVTGFVRNLQFAIESPINTTEYARKVEGRWYTSTAWAYTQSPEGRTYAAELERQAVAGRKLVRVISVDSPLADRRETWWSTVVENGDTRPHEVVVEIRQIPTDGKSGRKLSEEKFQIAPLSRTAIKPAVNNPVGSPVAGQQDSSDFARRFGQVIAVITIVDGKNPKTIDDIWSKITIRSELVPGGPVFNTGRAGMNFDGENILRDLGGRVYIVNSDEEDHLFSDVKLSVSVTSSKRGGTTTNNLVLDAGSYGEIVVPAHGPAEVRPEHGYYANSGIFSYTSDAGRFGGPIAEKDTFVSLTVKSVSFRLRDQDNYELSAREFPLQGLVIKP